MCGITGVFGGTDAMRLARSMNGCLAHRGPDDQGIAELRDARGSPCGALAQRRLAIIDLSPGGHQPMYADTGRYCIVFNGEIYNYRELRNDLQAAGERFVSGSDTEVILVGVARHGVSFIGELRGMFAFALWDREQSRVTLARDPFGIKPLFVVSRGEQVAFASESRALRNVGLSSATISPSAVASYLAWGSVAEPLAMLDDVGVLPAGSVVEVNVREGRASPPREIARFSPFRDGVERPAQHDPVAARSMVLDALRDSVSHHLIADVPVALFLSGGIDSTVVATLAAEASDRRLDSFTVVFDEAEFSEADHARAAAQAIGTAHHEIPLTGDDFFAALPEAFASMDQPSMDGLNTYVVSGAVQRAGIKVVLSGLGGDELFAGYPSFRRAAQIAPWWPAVRAARLPLGLGARAGGMHGAKIADMLRERSPAAAAYRASRSLFSHEKVRDLTGTSLSVALEPPPAGLSLLQQVSWYELTGYMRNTLLRDSDVFSMAHGLELRVPFVDRGVLAASRAVDDSLKLRSGMSKPLLIEALGDRLPRQVWDRPKRGFALPFASWMRGPLQEEVRSALSSRPRLERVGLSPDHVRAVWRGFLAGERGITWSRPWAIYTLVRWAEQVNASVVQESREATLRAPALAS